MARDKLRSGRLGKYNEERHKKIVDAVRAGNYLITAAKMSGLQGSAFWSWMTKGKHERELYPHYAKFYDDVRAAEAEAEAAKVLLIQRIAQGGQEVDVTTTREYDDSGTLVKTVTTSKRTPSVWQALAWLLERKEPERWGKRDTIKHELVQQEQGDALLEHLAGDISRDAYREVEASLKRLSPELADIIEASSPPALPEDSN